MYSCQNCNSALNVENLKNDKLFQLKPIPPVDLFQTSRDSALGISLHDLTICECTNCGLIQILSSPPANTFYDNYIYSSSSSPDMENNFRDFVYSSSQFFESDMNAKVLDIGCNDGLLLRCINKVYPNIELYGTDPSPVALKSAKENYILHNEYFPGTKTTTNGPYDIIIGTNSLAHIPRIGECFIAINQLLRDNGVLILEVSDIAKMVEQSAWDYIYHEHLYYYSQDTIKQILETKGFEIVKIQQINTKGGSLRVYARKRCNPLNIESSIKVKRNTYVNQLKTSHQECLDYLDKLEEDIISNNSRVFGYGACATATVSISQHKVYKRLEGIFDDNNQRHNLYSPHSGVKVLNLYDHKFQPNDIIIVFAWRFIDKIIGRITEYCNSSDMPKPIIIDAMHPQKNINSVR